VRRHLLVLGLFGASALALAGPVHSAADAWRIIGHASASGELAVAAASGTAEDPAQIAVRITAGRGASVSGTAVVACGNGYRAGSRTATRVSGPSQLFRLVRVPLRAESCDVVATASTTSGGRVVLQILER
jgi:hypothetical protein